VGDSCNGAPASRVVRLTLLALVLAFPVGLPAVDAALWQPAFDAAGRCRRLHAGRLSARSFAAESADAAQYRRHRAGQDDPVADLAVLLAWILARTDTPFRGTLEVLVTLPFFIPPILTAMAWGMLGNPQVGLLNQLYSGSPDRPARRSTSIPMAASSGT
jgi:iron(III) transport system permease protein